MMQEVFNEHYIIGDDTFKVVFLIKEGNKLDGGMMPYHIFEVQKLGDSTKFLFHKAEVGFGGKYGLVKADNKQQLTWTPEVHRELTNKISHQKIPSTFYIRPDLQSRFIE
ncbi:hypothetical protein [Mucilaginibacter flavidus]|uniref:hypothetical protein n=1 Tax=Mucilaginibacter flavidus TaxID=2949309 RepID=UPI0020937443|nr:hypothetical protein [Mucilaginibacter flavidus]MCO5946738.1 hypothetical protein [Mucilaginibacter flavidus]